MGRVSPLCVPVCGFWLLKDPSAHLPSSSLIPIGGFVGVCSAWSVGGVVFVEPVLSHMWPWHSDPEQDLCAPPAWKQRLWRARGANQTLQYSCVPRLVLISISSSASMLSLFSYSIPQYVLPLRFYHSWSHALIIAKVCRKGLHEKSKLNYNVFYYLYYCISYSVYNII